MTHPRVLAVLIFVQVLCLTFFAGEIMVGVLGLGAGSISWQVHELIEVGALLGLILGSGAGAFAWREARRRTARAEDQLRAASGAFMEMLDERFAEWKLTKAERDVALFLVKGLTTQEISGVRRTSEGTIKAQTNAIYRKADVANRAQLVSLFIDDLIQDPLIARAQDTGSRVAC